MYNSCPQNNQKFEVNFTGSAYSLNKFELLKLKEIKQTSGEDPLPIVAFECVVIVSIPQGSIESQGHGQASESYPKEGCASYFMASTFAD